MVKKKMKGFTLIELIAVLVIMAIIALIVTPLVMSIIKKAKVSADKRSIDAYGRSVELAIAGYLLDNGSFPTSIEQLTIEYSGDEVVCSTTQLNSDSSVYLAGCTVGGRSVEGYTYGKEETTPAPSYTAYEVGDHVSYNGVTYYVIEDSDTTNDTVKLLKENPLTKTEMDNLNLTGITITESNGYGTVQYGSSTDYSTSTVKQVVDAWKNSAVVSGDTAIARLITTDDASENLGYEYVAASEEEILGEIVSIPACYNKTQSTPAWVYNSRHSYWTMSPADDSSSVWGVSGYQLLGYSSTSDIHMVRPVLELSKSANITMAS